MITATHSHTDLFGAQGYAALDADGREAFRRLSLPTDDDLSLATRQIDLPLDELDPMDIRGLPELMRPLADEHAVPPPHVQSAAIEMVLGPRTK